MIGSAVCKRTAGKATPMPAARYTSFIVAHGSCGMQTVQLDNVWATTSSALLHLLKPYHLLILQPSKMKSRRCGCPGRTSIVCTKLRLPTSTTYQHQLLEEILRGLWDWFSTRRQRAWAASSHASGNGSHEAHLLLRNYHRHRSLAVSFFLRIFPDDFKACRSRL